MRLLARVVPFCFPGILIFIPVNAHAQFKGCHNWCGKQANNAWWAVMHSHGVTSGSAALQEPHRAEANAAKEEAFRVCMQQTLAEGKTSDADCDGASPTNGNPSSGSQAACKAQALEVISRCEGGYGGASGACASSRVDTAVQQAQAANEQRLNQSSGSYAQACSETAQAYQNAVSQLGSIQSSCQSSVTQCSTDCERAQAAIQQCQDPEVVAKSSVVSTALQACASGPLSRRPIEIARASDSLRQSAGDASRCAQNTGSAADGGANVSASPSGSFASGQANTSSGSLDPKAGGSTYQSDVSGTGGPSPGGSFSAGNSAVGTPAGSGIDKTYDVSGKNAASASNAGDDMMASNAALAALPGTPSPASKTEQEEAPSGRGSATPAPEGATAEGGGGRGGGGRFLLMSRQGGASGAADGKALKASGRAGEGAPDLSAFLPDRRGVAGGVIAGLAGCRIPDPANPKQCAIPHGPAADLWKEVKERFELLRNVPPPSDYFFNED